MLKNFKNSTSLRFLNNIRFKIQKFVQEYLKINKQFAIPSTHTPSILHNIQQTPSRHVIINFKEKGLIRIAIKLN